MGPLHMLLFLLFVFQIQRCLLSSLSLPPNLKLLFPVLFPVFLVHSATSLTFSCRAYTCFPPLERASCGQGPCCFVYPVSLVPRTVPGTHCTLVEYYCPQALAPLQGELQGGARLRGKQHQPYHRSVLSPGQERMGVCLFAKGRQAGGTGAVRSRSVWCRGHWVMGLP